MATQEKLLKSLEVLKNLSSPNQAPDHSNFRKKDKIQHCHIVTEAISNSTIKIAPNFHTYLSITIEVLLQLCDDQESDIRMTAEECLNRIIRAMHDSNIGKVLIELHKGIKKNGPTRSLRACLWRFSQLAHLIRPHKGKPYAANLFPTIIKISERTEEQIHETLASSLSKIMKVLGSFTSDNETKALLRAFLKNVTSQSAAIRRTTASCVLSVCLNCRKPHVFIVYVINYLLDLLVPVNENHGTSLILGMLTCLKTLLPHMKQLNGKPEIRGSFGVSKEADLVIVSVDKLLQIYELCLYYSANKDHNIVNAALETLNILLQNCPSELNKALISPNGITKTRITLAHTSSLSRMRSPSQLSVATNVPSDDLFAESELTETVRSDIEKWIDESKLSVMNITYAKTSTALEKTFSTESKSTDISEMDSASSYEYNKIDGYSKSRSIDDNLEKMTLSDKSSEKSVSCTDDERFSEASLFQDICIGSYLDKDVPLVYCARVIAKSFLLTGQPGGTMPDKNVRISVKSLALACLSSILKIYPKIFTLYLDKDAVAGTNKPSQQISDVCLYANHSDPQLRGAVRTLIAHFIKAVLVETDGRFEQWLDENRSNFRVENFIKMFIKGLEDESSNCSRQSIISLGIVLEALAESSGSSCIVPILNVLPRLALNPYWLVKVSLCDLISKLPYVTLHDITGNGNFQNVILHNVLFELLQDSDLRVRNAAANAVVSIVPFLYHEQQCAVIRKALHHKNKHLSNLNNNNFVAPSKRLVQNMPFPFNNILCKSCDNVEFSLSKIVSMLFNNLLTSASKHFIHGCVETLALLCKTYPTTVYRKAWNCARKSKNDAESGEITLDLLSVCLGLLKSTVVSYDLNCHLNLLSLSSNLYAGIALCLLCPVQDVENTSTMFSDEKFARFSKDFLSHTVKLLNIFHYVLDDLVPAQSHSKTMLPNLSAANPISPIKRRKSDVEKKILSPGKGTEKDDNKDKKEGVKPNSTAGAFIQSLHYMKIYEILRSSYTNYKISLDSEVSEKLLDLLKQTLHTLAVLLEVGSLTEYQGVAEEILGYFRSTFSLEASGTVECVQQLLKCLFGTNLTSNLMEVREELLSESEGTSISDNNGFYHCTFQAPYDEISACFAALKTINKIECDGGDSTVMGYLHRKDKPLPSKSSDKVLASFIRIFEPMVIKSLKEYTISSNVKLQCRVLQLLSQLIQLRVNYCLLDSEQIFIGFVLKQFEYIEEGQVPFSDELVPKIFQFLVHLSYSKQHSRSIISIPKIIQLCDGLMASGQSPVTHCIPALEPIVEDIFLTRNKSNTYDIKELETTRDVVLAMLLRLSEYHDVIDLIVLILEDSKYCSDNLDKWLRWSTQVAGVLIPMLKQNKIKLDSRDSFNSFRKLIFALNPNVFRPVDAVVLLLFQEPLIEESSTVIYTRWLSKILLALLILSPIKEDTVIAKISELKVDFAPGTIFENITTTIDPLNVTNSADYFHDVSSEMIFARFLFKTIGIISKRCIDIAKNEDCDFLVEELSVLLMYCLHIFQSGSHGKIASYAVSNLNEIQLEAINHNFLQLSGYYPILTFLWCYFLTLLNYNEKTFWSKIMCDGDAELSINAKVVRTGAVILFCDYMTEDVFESDQLSWFLSNCITVLVTWCDETPILEFISSIHRHPVASKLFLKNIFQNCLGFNDSVFVMKILKCVENTHPCHTGLLLKLLLPNLLVSRQLAVSRLVANLASRKLELLLTMSMEDVNRQLAKEDLLETIKKLVKLKLERKHQALSSLLNKLCTQYYDISPLEFDQKRSINPEHIKKLQINKTWYLSQVKAKCGDVKLGDETAELLNRLDYDDILNVMNSPEFNKVIFKNCLALSIDSETPLFKATVGCLLKAVEGVVKEIPEPHQVYNVREKALFSEQISAIFKNDECLSPIYDLIPSISYYVQSASSSAMEPADFENVFKFGVVCLESAQFLIDSDRTNVNIKLVDAAVNCSSLIFKEKSTISADVQPIWLCSAVNSLYKVIECFLLHDEPLPSLLQCGLSDTNDDPTGLACYQSNVLICWMGKAAGKVKSIPEFLLEPLKSLIVSLARMPLVNSYVIIPAKAWKSGWQPELGGDRQHPGQIPPLPIEFLQEIDILEEFIYRVTLLGWTSRQQFEETWMSLLSVLCNSPGDDDDPAEINDIIHASTLAVKSITALLLQTLHHPVLGNTNVSKLIHVSRDSLTWDQSLCIQKLKKIHASIERKYSESTYLPRASNVFSRPNFEKHNADQYSYNQMSIKYLLIATDSIEPDDHDCEATVMWKRRSAALKQSGLDVNSCLQFLLEFYTQLLDKNSTPLRFHHEIMRSIVIISDLFTEKSQFVWMLDVFQKELAKLHASVEDELLHQYLIVGICKAAAVLTPDLETYENIKKMLVLHLKSTFLPTRMACLHGLLYILEGCILSNISIGGISDEMQLILPCAVEYIQCNLNPTNDVLKRSQEHTLLVWSLAFYLMENVQDVHMESNFVTNTIQAAFGVLLQQKPNFTLHLALMKGLERLVIVKRKLTGRISKQIVSLALEKLRNDNPCVSILGKQLLLTYMYTDCAEHLEASAGNSAIQTNPDYLVQTIEKIAAIFEHIKKGYGFEVEILCWVLPAILNDFFSPSDILTKVIGEFLSPQQPHPKLLSRVVFQVFQRAIEQQQLPLLQDWVVFSLSNITQSLSVGMATWCLTCFFISASSNEWLRLFFPYVQTRVGRYEYEDRKMLCIAGSDFYKNLTNEVQKKAFIENFSKIKDQPDKLFNDLLYSL